MEARRDALAAIGDRPVEVPQERFYDRRHRLEYLLAPRVSALTGRELADGLEQNAVALRAELERARAELDALVEG